MRSDTRSRRVAHLFDLNQNYRAIWEKTYSQPELLRIRKADLDLKKNPITESEQRLVKEIIQHIYVVYVAIQNNQFEKHETGKDVAGLLQLPIPNSVWQEVKGYENKRFVRYIDTLLNQDINDD